MHTTSVATCRLLHLLDAAQQVLACEAACEANAAPQASFDTTDTTDTADTAEVFDEPAPGGVITWFHICALCQMSQRDDAKGKIADWLLQDALTHGLADSPARTTLYHALAARHASNCPFLPPEARIE
jgi:hypothetical protein